MGTGRETGRKEWYLDSQKQGTHLHLTLGQAEVLVNPARTSAQFCTAVG